MLPEWLDRRLRLGYSPQFCSGPPPFRGVREVTLSLQEEIDFLSSEIQDLLQKQAGFNSIYFLVPKKKDGVH